MAIFRRITRRTIRDPFFMDARSLLSITLPILLGLPTLAAESTAQHRVAILGCHRQYHPAPALYKYVEAKPDISIWVGDNVYADSENDPAIIEAAYAQLHAKPAFRSLRDSSIFLATWDDHDYGLNNAGKEYALKEESKKIFRAFWDLEAEIPQDRDGIYFSKTFSQGPHTLQIIMLDVRYNRDQPYSGGDVLGEAQWAWLEEQLNQPASLRFIVSGMQVLLPEEAGSETWDQFPEAQQRLFDTIKRTRAEGVVFITGDQHYAEVARMRAGLDYDIIELQFASINQIEEPEFNPYRISPVARSLHTYAYIDIQWETDNYDVPHLNFEVRDALNDQIELTYRINLSELERAIHFESLDVFARTHQVTLSHQFPELNIHYTLDGSRPDNNSSPYIEPILLSNSTTITAALFDASGMRRSMFQEQAFQRLDVHASTPPSQNLQKGLAYRYIEGTFKMLPDFNTLNKQKEGIALDFDVAALARREDHYAIEYSGYLEVPETGLYTFYTYSDDGSKLYITEQLVVNNDGSHSARLKEGRIALEAGLHPIRIQYFEDYDGQVLEVHIKAPGSSNMRPLSFDTLYHP